MYGGRKGRSTHSAELPGAIEIELNKDENEHMLGTSEDYNKCFDTISAKLTIELWKKMGINPNILRGIEHIYDNHERIMYINGYVDNPRKTCSLVQGCAFSLHMVNSLFAVLSLRLSKISPDVKYQFFVDDSKNRANIKFFDQMMEAKKEREIFNSLAGLILNPTKCIAWGSSDKARKLARQLIPAQGRLVKYFPSLGYVVNTTKGIRRIEMDQKCLKADKVLDKIAKLPNTKKTRNCTLPQQ